MPIVSIIVPIYMIEKYIGICIESIIKQTYKNIEIILVDDGSSDQSSEICDLYASKDNRIKVIHKKNGGLVSARKAGLRIATGKYVACIDGDDWIEPDYIETLMEYMINSDSDIVCAGYTRDIFFQSVKMYNAYGVGVYENEKLDELRLGMMSCNEFYHPGINTYLWNKIFKRSILFSCQMNVDDRITIGEDAAVTYPAIYSSKKLVVIDNTSYHYRQREDSMLKKFSSLEQERQKLNLLYGYLLNWSKCLSEKSDPKEQVTDFILANAIMRSGGVTSREGFDIFDGLYYGKRIVICFAGSFGQQMFHVFTENKLCDVVSWVDDDYWEYRRSCLNVDPIESIKEKKFDYVMIAKLDPEIVKYTIRRLEKMGIKKERILTVKINNRKDNLIREFFQE